MLVGVCELSITNTHIKISIFMCVCVCVCVIYIQISILCALLYLPGLLSYERTQKPTSHTSTGEGERERGKEIEREAKREGEKERTCGHEERRLANILARTIYISPGLEQFLNLVLFFSRFQKCGNRNMISTTCSVEKGKNGKEEDLVSKY